jgi:myo-inositol-1-phosphate synthase
MLVDSFEVQSPNVVYTDESITSTYEYSSTKLDRAADGKWVVKPTKSTYQFRVDRRVPKLG